MRFYQMQEKTLRGVAVAVILHAGCIFAALEIIGHSSGLVERLGGLAVAVFGPFLLRSIFRVAFRKELSKSPPLRPNEDAQFNRTRPELLQKAFLLGFPQRSSQQPEKRQ